MAGSSGPEDVEMQELEQPAQTPVESRLRRSLSEMSMDLTADEQEEFPLKRKNSIAEGQTCAICYDLPACVELPCGHNGFCVNCVRNPKVSEKGCPVCRKAYHLKDVKPKFNKSKLEILAEVMKKPDMARKLSAERKVESLVKAYPFDNFLDYLQEIDPLLRDVAGRSMETYRVTPEAWFAAIQEGNANNVRQLLDLKPDKNSSPDILSWVTPGRKDGCLYLSCKQGSTELVNLLLEKNAQVNVPNVIGSTPLITAAGQGNPDIVAKLLAHKADVWHSTEVGATALVVAAQSGHKDVCRVLTNSIGEGMTGDARALAIKKYVNHKCTSQGASPLLYAMNGYHKETTMLLVELGANVNDTAKNGLTVLHLVAPDDKLHDLLCIFLERGVDPKRKTELGQNCLFDAAKAGATKNVQKLLEVCNPNDADIHGCTCLHAASTFNHPAVVKQLLDAKADIEARFGRNQWTPLHSAAHEGATQCVIALAESGAEIDSKVKGGGQDGYTPLTLACLHKANGFYYDPHVEIVNELLKRGADPTLSICRDNSSIFRFGTGPMKNTIDIVKEKMPEYAELIKILEAAAAERKNKMDTMEPGAPDSLGRHGSGNLSTFSLGRQIHEH